MAEDIDPSEVVREEQIDPALVQPVSVLGEAKKGLARGVDSMQQAGYGLIAAAAKAGGASGIEGWAREGIARNQEEAKANPPVVPRVEDIGTIRDAALWAGGGLGELAPYVGESIAAGAAGAAVGGPVGAALAGGGRLLTPAARLAARTAGANVGAGLSSVGIETGSIAADQAESGEIKPGQALAYGAAAGALDVLPQARVINRLAGRAAARGVIPDVFTQAGLEGVTEGAQTALERAGADKEAFSKEGLSEMLNAAALGALGGGVIAGAARPFSGAFAPPEEPPPAPQPAPAGLLPAPGQTVIPMGGPTGGGPNLDLEAAEMNAGAIYAARDAFEAERARAAQQPAPPLALPAPGTPLGNIALPSDAGPFAVTQQHIANDAQDHADAVEAARAAEIARLEASGPIGRAAAAAMRTGAAEQSATARADEAAGARPDPLALPEPLTTQAKRAHERVTKFAADLPSLPLAQAQAVARAATTRFNEPVVVVPHPSGRGFTAVPEKVVAESIREQFSGIQREGGLPSPQSPTGTTIVSPDGQARAQTAGERNVGMQTAMADWRRDMGTPTPRGAAPQPVAGNQPFIPPQLPIKKQAAAIAKAKQRTAETGVEHDVVPHPFMRDAFAIRALPTNVHTEDGKADTSAERVQGIDMSTNRGQEPAVDISPVDAAAREAATSLANDLPQPTRAQAEAGNYRKGHIKLHGLDISIENPAGSVRVGESEDGDAWASSLPYHYGYIRRSEGADGDHVDTFVGPKPDAATVFVVNQIDPQTGKFDEHKVMLGFDTQAQAEAAYRAAYPKDWSGMGTVVATDVAGLKSWLKSGDTKEEFGAPAVKLGAEDLAGINIREPVQVEETGETVYIERGAKEALVESRSRVRKLEALLKCLKS